MTAARDAERAGGEAREARGGGTAAARRRIVYVRDRPSTALQQVISEEIRALAAEGFAVECLDLDPAPGGGEAAPRGGRLRAWWHYALRRPLALLGLALTLPLDNDRPGKAVKSVGHLALAVHFAWRLRGRPAHVHAHLAFRAALAGLAHARLNGGSFSFTARGSAILRKPDRYSLRSKLRGAAFVVAVSEYNRRAIGRLCPGLPPDRVMVNRAGVLLERFPYRARAARPEGPRRLVCVASLFPAKNHEGLLRACALLAEQGLDFRLDLLGADSRDRRERLETLALAFGIGDRVRFHGRVDHGEVARHLREADLFVLASHSEGAPVSVMEAMALGTPVLAPRVTVLPELVEEGVSGLLADPRRPEEFAERMARLLQDPDRAAAMARHARERIERNYDMRANARALARLFAERLGGAGA
ncbi:MAG: glycosyltransferase family 4 protein [Candidatus Krumholzibacteriota bacterium]|nr:glycosyltransferase family 4 protein [Candidatus Krumholzibacteriota bacterium]